MSGQAKQKTKPAKRSANGEIRVERNQLRAALRSVEAAVDSKSARPESKDVRLAIEDGELLIEAASPGKLRVRHTIAYAGGARKLNVQMQHRALSKLVAASAETIALAPAGDDQMELRSGKRSLKLKVAEADRYPSTPAVSERRPFLRLDATAFAGELAIAIRCASAETNRPTINAVAIDATADAIRLVATDSYRLCALPLTGEIVPGAELPSSLLLIELAVAKSIAGDLRRIKPESVEIDLYGHGVVGGVVVSYGDCEWACPTVSGTYPNWRDLIPADGETLKLDPTELDGVISTIAALSGGNGKTSPSSSSGTLRLELGEKITISYLAAEVGELVEELTESDYAGEPVTIGFNPAFLGEVTKVITDEELAARVSGPARPALFTGADGRIYLVMPVRIA